MIRINERFSVSAVREIVAVYRDKKREEANKGKRGEGEGSVVKDTVVIGKRDVVPVPKQYLTARS